MTRRSGTAPAARRGRAASVISILIVLAAALAGCAVTGAEDGDGIARRAADRVAAQVGESAGVPTGLRATEIVTRWVPEEPVPIDGGMATVEALAWSGVLTPGTTASVDVRVHADVDARSLTSIGGRSNSAGEATRCYRVTWAGDAAATRTEIDCPDGPAPPRPVSARQPTLAAEDVAVVDRVLAGYDGIDEVTRALRDRFAHVPVRIDAELWHGELVVAVGIPRARDCILAVRDADGAIRHPEARSVSLEPGEVGCSTTLYTAPPF